MPVAVDEAQHGQRRGGQDDHLQPDRQPLADDDPQQRRVGAQVTQFRTPQAQRQVAGVEIGHHGAQADVVCDGRRGGGPGDAEFRCRTEPEDEDRVQAAVEHDAQSHEPQRRQRIAGAAQRHHQQGQHQHSRDRQEDDPQVAQRVAYRLGRRTQKVEETRRQQPADPGDHDGKGKEGARGRADDPPRVIDVAPAEGLPDQDRRGHAEAEHERDQQEHDDVAVRRGRERVLAQEAADPDGVDRAVQRLQHRGCQRRQGEEQQGRADRTGDEITLAGERRARGRLGRRTGQAQDPIVEPARQIAFFVIVTTGIAERNSHAIGNVFFRVVFAV